MGIVHKDDENLSKHHRKRKHFLAQELEERAKSEERKRISRDLHDRVAHDLGVAHQSLQLYKALKHRDPKTGTSCWASAGAAATSTTVTSAAVAVNLFKALPFSLQVASGRGYPLTSVPN